MSNRSSLIGRFLDHPVRFLGNAAGHVLFHEKTFRALQRLGAHVLPNRYLFPVPDTRLLPDDLWERPTEMPGVDMNDAEQADLLARFEKDFKAEYDDFPKSAEEARSPFVFHLGNGAFESVDAEALYGMVRLLRPRRIIEIGSGNTTLISAQAIGKNKELDPEYSCDLIAVEPYPNAKLLAGFPHLTRLIRKRVQEVPLELFAQLGEGDILFIDSSHILEVGSDVRYEVLEILPRLKKGVVVHFHDIFLPAEYPRDWILHNRWFWNEQYVLQAFLAFNDAFTVTLAAGYMHARRPELLERTFASYDRLKTRPGSFWMRKTR